MVGARSQPPVFWSNLRSFAIFGVKEPGAKTQDYVRPSRLTEVPRTLEVPGETQKLSMTKMGLGAPKLSKGTWGMQTSVFSPK